MKCQSILAQCVVLNFNLVHAEQQCERGRAADSSLLQSPVHKVPIEFQSDLHELIFDVDNPRSDSSLKIGTLLQRDIASRRPYDYATDKVGEEHPTPIFFHGIFFNYREGDHFLALKKLLDDFAEYPENMLTNTYLTTVGIWMGGEADYALLDLRHVPHEYFADSFAVWDIGCDAWVHREWNLEANAALHQNDDPSDDPSHFLLKQYRWVPWYLQLRGLPPAPMSGMVGGLGRAGSILDRWDTTGGTWQLAGGLNDLVWLFGPARIEPPV